MKRSCDYACHSPEHKIARRQFIGTMAAGSMLCRAAAIHSAHVHSSATTDTAPIAVVEVDVLVP